ncbi:NUDIX domain-containing protein [Methylocella tundrae]|uniref:GDP-mannose pyrophosphatase n=1 Tax=Methylocella tundrae TaxID=227605 RepID=A0A4V6IMQ2_METTU|nr:NUDIX domain-containing protein [Methylocella tundrae]WPP03277.1 NUDIX domain-containing protein [Methylocella tundrae]VFU09297.1 GDP-mannose pyrophosphatase NudK [Methylocella tundrae]
MKERVRILARDVMSRGHGLLERLTIELKRFDGRPQKQVREIYDTGDGAAILLYDPTRSTVVLVRQFRLPAYLKDGRDNLIEVCAGRLEGIDAQTRIVHEAEEETGYKVRHARKVCEGYSSPGSFGEKLTFFVAEYAQSDRVGPGGGLEHEGEDIEVLEVSLDEALLMIERGEIIDTKSILLLQYAKLKGLMEHNGGS